MLKKRILVVDDDTKLAKAIQIRLEQADYEVLTAFDGMEALEKARKERPDLVILDIMLPKIDGYKVCAMLKSDMKNLPVIMLTAKAGKSDDTLGLNVGADAYITKPYETQQLLETIRKLLAGDGSTGKSADAG